MEKISLNTGWQFEKLPGRSIMDIGAGHTVMCDQGRGCYVDLPHTWYQDDDQYRGLTVYKKTIYISKYQGKRVFLDIEGAGHTVRAFASGIDLGIHKGGYSRVRFAVPKACMNQDELELELFVDNGITEDVSPLAGDFTVMGGLYRDVSLLVCGEIHFDYTYYGTDGVIVRAHVDENGDGILNVEPHVIGSGLCSEASVQYTVKEVSGRVAAEHTGSVCDTQTIRIPAVKLWNGKADAALYEVDCRLTSDGICMDFLKITTGFKKISIDSRHGFYLNGNKTKIRGVAKHQDCAGCFSAVTELEIDRDFALIDEIGANAVRLSHYQHPQYTYDCCDQKGYLVWAEIPMLKMTEKAALLENAKMQLMELILQNIHHPSICFWGVQNEIAMFRDAPFVHENVKILYHTAKQLDHERIVACANLYPLKAKSRLNHLTDLVGYNLYFGWYYGKMTDYGAYLDELHNELADVPLGISEYGVDAAVWLHSEHPLVKDYSEEFQSLFHETVYPLLESKEYLWGSFIWNMFDFSSAGRDEGGQKCINAKGLVTYDRNIKKDAFYYYKARWSDTPFLHICESRFVRRCQEKINIKVYTNLKKAVLKRIEENEAAGDKLCAQNNGGGIIVFADIALKDGKNYFSVSGLTKDNVRMEESVCFEKTAVPEESYCLPGQNAGTTVQNWFMQETDLDTDQYYSLKDRAEEILDNEKAHQILKKYLPKITRLLEQGDIPLALAMTSILGRDKETAEKADLSALNAELVKIAK